MPCPALFSRSYLLYGHNIILLFLLNAILSQTAEIIFYPPAPTFAIGFLCSSNEIRGKSVLLDLVLRPFVSFRSLSYDRKYNNNSVGTWVFVCAQHPVLHSINIPIYLYIYMHRDFYKSNNIISPTAVYELKRLKSTRIFYCCIFTLQLHCSRQTAKRFFHPPYSFA